MATTAPGRTVQTTLAVRGGVRPLTIVTNFIESPLTDRDNIIHTAGTVEGEATRGTTTGIVPGDIDQAEYEIYNVVVVDSAGCTTLYYSAGPNSVVYQPAPEGPLPQTHGLDLDKLALTVTSDELAPPDILNPLDWNRSQRYLNSLALVFFDRPATAPELRSHPRLDTEQSRLKLTQRMAGSQEWAGGVVDDIYEAALDRPADDAGRSYWAERLWVDGTTRDIAIAIYGSPEAFNAAGGTNEAFVVGLYNRILQRDPDLDGMSFWLDLLDSGQAGPLILSRHSGDLSNFAVNE